MQLFRFVSFSQQFKITLLLVLLASGAALALDEDYVILDGGARIPIRKAIPVLSETGNASTFSASTSRLRIVSNLQNGTRTSHQGFHVDYRISPENAPEIGYDLDAGFRMLDSITGDSIDPPLSRHLKISQGGHLKWTGPNRLELILSSGMETLAQSEQPLQEYAFVQRGRISLYPIPLTTIRSSIGSTDRHRIDGATLYEEALSIALERHIAPLPLRLTLTQTSAWQSLQDSPTTDVERHRLLGAAHWNFQAGNTLSMGFESSMISREATGSIEQSSITFTEIRIEPLPQFGLRLRATVEDRDIPNATAEDSRILIPSISAGMDFQLTPSFETGIGILYRPNAPATPANPTPSPTHMTVFGTALF